MAEPFRQNSSRESAPEIDQSDLAAFEEEDENEDQDVDEVNNEDKRDEGGEDEDDEDEDENDEEFQMKKISQKLRFTRKKNGPNSSSDAMISTQNDSQCRQNDEELGQSHDGSNINHNQLDREELDTAMQAASQALQNTRGITGKDDKPGHYRQLTASVVDKLSTFTNLVQKIADAHPYSKIAWMIISSAVTVTAYAQDVEQNIIDLFTTLESTYNFIEETKDIESHPSYEHILTNLAKQTVECAYFIRDYAKAANFWIRIGKNLVNPIKARVKIYQDAFERILTDFRNHSVLHTEIAVGRILEWNESISETLFLGNFPYASGAGLHTGKKCLPGTRAEILDHIINWINDVNDDCPRLFWLAGPAGVGKSAIAHSIALWFQSIGRLGSFFCFDRNRSTERREKVFSTIARDLADLDIQIKRELVKVIHNKTSLQSTTDLYLQWTHLLLEPLQALSEASTGPILVVIDALDESAGPISRQELLKVLAKETSSLPANIRFLVTSRPEQDIVAAFRGLQSSGRIRTKMMDSIPDTETKRDILTYFKTNLNGDEDSSFGDSQLRRLVELSQGLFQWAYLALQFLRGLGNTAGSTIIERYDDLINVQRVDSINDNLDAMYTQILSSLFNTKQPRVMTRFRSVIGSILAASEPLSLNSLVALRRGNISSSQRETDIKAVIQYMGSVLSGIDDPSSTIRPLHLSFREYLLDKDRSNEFFIDLSQFHQDFAFACLHTMNEGLRFNICDISNSHQSNADDKDLPARISSRISISLSYSSRFWGLHVVSSTTFPLLATKIEEFLHRNFLHWLEVMSLLRAVHVASRSMYGLISWSSGSLHDFAVDGNRFIRLFSDAMTLSTPHVYLSALSFCPEKSIIYQTFIHQFPNTLRVASDPIYHWPLGQRSTSLLGNVTCICFSHGGDYLAVGLSQGILKLFDSETFNVLWNKELSEEDSVEGIQFLPDDKSLLFATPTGIYLLDILTGGVTLYNSFRFLFRVAFSPDARFIATFNPSHLIVWNLQTDEQVMSLPFDINQLSNTSFSITDNGTLVTYFFNIGVQVWDLETGVMLHGPFLPPSHLIGNVTTDVSPNGKHIIFTDGLRLIAWNFCQGSAIYFDKPDTVSLTVSPDGDCVFARSSDGRLSLHYMNGVELCYEIARGIKKVVCSKDGRWLAVRSDKSLVIRELDGGLEPLAIDPSLLDASSDGKYFISTSVGDSLEVRDVQSGQSIRKISRDTELASTTPIFSSMNRYTGDISGQKFVNVYDMDYGTSKQISFDDEKIRIQGVAFSHDEKRLATLSIPYRMIYIWDINSSKIVETLTIPDSLKYEDYRVFGASSNFRYFAYILFNGDVTLMDRMQPFPLELPTREELGYMVRENVAFSLDEEYMLISRGSAVFHINLITKEHRVVRLQQENHAISLQYKKLPVPSMFRRKLFITPGSETLLVEVDSIMGYSIWDASSGQHLYCTPANEYPPVFVDGFIPVHHYLFTTTKSNGHARISRLKQKKDNRICFSSDDRYSLHLDHESSARLREDGWVLTQDDELLFWVPKDYHSILHVPGLVYILGKKSIELDLSSFSHGESWTNCTSTIAVNVDNE